jgi:hypothetical protein
MAMQDRPVPGRGRLRFGPDAYWRKAARLQGIWKAVGTTNSLQSRELQTEELPLVQLEFDVYQNVTALLPTGEHVASHRWFLKNQYIWHHWYASICDHPDRTEVPLQFIEQHLYIALPPSMKGASYLVLDKLDDE